jgi:hypothetical protein
MNESENVFTNDPRPNQNVIQVKRKTGSNPLIRIGGITAGSCLLCISPNSKA